MLVIIAMFFLIILILALTGAGIYYWVNKDDIDLPDAVAKFVPKGKSRSTAPTTRGLKKRKSVLGGNELKCYSTLLKVAGKNARVFPKVRLTDILSPSRDADGGTVQLISESVDFLLVHPTTLAPVLAVNVERKPRRDEAGNRIRDENPRTNPFAEDALRVAGVPLMKLVAQDAYDADDVARRVKLVMAGNTTEQDAEFDVEPESGSRVTDIASRLKSGMPKLRARG